VHFLTYPAFRRLPVPTNLRLGPPGLLAHSPPPQLSPTSGCTHLESFGPFGTSLRHLSRECPPYPFSRTRSKPTPFFSPCTDSDLVLFRMGFSPDLPRFLKPSVSSRVSGDDAPPTPLMVQNPPTVVFKSTSGDVLFQPLPVLGPLLRN